MNQLPGLERAHFARMRGSILQNEAYITKQNAMTHFGLPFQGIGARTDRNQYFAALESGKSNLELMRDDFSAYTRFRGSTADYRSYITPVRTHPLEVYLFFGPPGTGKTKFAYQQLGVENYRIPLSDQFWLTPASSGKKMILVDEFRANMKLHLLLQLLDEYAIEVQLKGGFIWWQPEVIVITSNRSIHTWYKYEHRDMEREALFRRFDNGGIFRFEKNVDRVPRPFQIDINNPVDFDYPWVDYHDRPNIMVGNGMLARQDHFAVEDPTDDLFPGMIREEML